ncbi:type I DNA topoisomerase [Candidatus Daviesbacteria bacterium]|nr:type I DNA topoisomerase [Candidatus Daviesbacteria bacterium]
MNNLVIVESPTKARTLARFLGNSYQIEASMGHIRDLPKAELGIDIEANFEPKYIIPRDKRKRVNELKKIAKGAKQIWLATDPDREGEAIAWHTAELLSNPEVKLPSGGPRLKVKSGQDQREVRLDDLAVGGDRTEKNLSKSVQIKRVVFHEITKEAIDDAFKNPRDIDIKLVDAQQARRVLDRLVGYKLSPLLWQKIKRGLSAGRVQSVALRLIVEKEREIEKFKPQEYWVIEVELENTEKQNFFVKLIEVNGKKADVKDKKEADKIVADLKEASYQISKITQKQVKRYPSPPFITSTLVQNAGNKLGFTAKKTMMLSQNLYEQGLITYMRTDSFNLAQSALSAIRAYISSNFSKAYLPHQPKFYKSKSKNAQEAHEAIRPTKIGYRMSDVGIQNGLTRDHGRLYDLIWKRTLASQMNEAVLDQTTVDVVTSLEGDREERSRRTPAAQLLQDEEVRRDTELAGPPKNKYLLRATGSVLKFDGWLGVYGVKQVEEESFDSSSASLTADAQDKDERKQILPKLSEGEDLNMVQVLPSQHFTEPPPRYTEASLIKKLEELGIGRPSTYAPILATITERYYIERKERKLFPTPLGIAVVDFLIKYFPDVFDYKFTANMEDQLDEISRGERPWKETLKNFYTPFEEKLEKTEEKAGKVKLELEMTDEKCPNCGKNLVIRIGRFGKFLACSGFPECKYTGSLDIKINAKCPQDGGEIVVRRTKKGRVFYGCKNYPNCKYASWTKPKEEKV